MWKLFSETIKQEEKLNLKLKQLHKCRMNHLVLRIPAWPNYTVSRLPLSRQRSYIGQGKLRTFFYLIFMAKPRNICLLVDAGAEIIPNFPRSTIRILSH